MMLMNAKGQELPTEDPQIPLFYQEVQLKAVWEGKCVAVEIEGKVTEGAIVDLRHTVLVAIV